MKTSAYDITLISLHERIQRTVIAHNTVQAIRIGIGMMPSCFAPCGITCKPRQMINQPQETTQCVA